MELNYPSISLPVFFIIIILLQYGDKSRDGGGDAPFFKTASFVAVETEKKINEYTREEFVS